jgi:hypothetical protein
MTDQKVKRIACKYEDWDDTVEPPVCHCEYGIADCGYAPNKVSGCPDFEPFNQPLDTELLLTEKEIDDVFCNHYVNGQSTISTFNYKERKAYLEAQVSKCQQTIREWAYSEIGEWLFEKSTAQEVDFPPRTISFIMLYSEWEKKFPNISFQLKSGRFLETKQ